jgi:Lanthionine synthetase C-like protein
MLFDPDRFETLTETPWDEGRVKAAIAAIVADADEAFSPTELWPTDEWDAWNSPTPMKGLYVGAGGVVWALDVLRRRTSVESSLDLADAARRALELWREAPDFPAGIDVPSPAASSLLCGEAGLLLVAWRLAPDAAIADLLHTRIIENATNEAKEVMWGAPGTMLAARAMQEWTGESRWADAWRTSADEVEAARDADGLWTQHMYGATARSLGPPHGLVGNTLALLQGDLGDERRASVVATATDALERNAAWEEGLVTWPTRDGGELVGGDGEVRLQWCGGAPGIVIAAVDYLPEELFLPAAELIWRAGPHGLEKGAGICHGTAGNGYALLKTFERTGDEKWLEGARRFAVHALEQVDRLRERRGRGRYSLWTGDIGVAVYAADCLAGRAAYPIFDTV